MSLYGVVPVLLANWFANILKIIIRGILFVEYYNRIIIIFGLDIDLVLNPSIDGLFLVVIGKS